MGSNISKLFCKTLSWRESFDFLQVSKKLPRSILEVVQLYDYDRYFYNFDDEMDNMLDGDYFLTINTLTIKGTYSRHAFKKICGNYIFEYSEYVPYQLFNINNICGHRFAAMRSKDDKNCYFGFASVNQLNCFERAEVDKKIREILLISDIYS